MDLSLNDTQLMLKKTVEDFIVRDANRDKLIELQQTERGYSDEIWRTASELGWVGMMIPEQYGGGGSDFATTAAVYEALGKGPVPGPMFSSGILCGQIILQVGTEEQKKQYLPSIASGDIVAAFAMTEPDYQWGSVGVRLRPTESGSDYVLNGTKLFVYDGHVADWVITAVRTGDGADDISLLMVDTKAAGVTTKKLNGFTTSESEVTFNNVKVPKANLLGGKANGIKPALDRALMYATPILCAYKVGGAQAAVDMAVQYSRDRVQFGRPIGRFQFVQNHIVQAVNHLDAARWTTNEVLWKLDTGQDARVGVHLAKTLASEGYRKACDYVHEVHAGLGIMREYGLTLYTRGSRSLYAALGEPRYHRRQIANLIETIE
ncbi:MAG: acyl-CoA dehydrogenase [Dehalococcoidia bacterium]|nr:acyl-CoA dehydrogenase [Dehalococcoidia bacterium]